MNACKNSVESYHSRSPDESATFQFHRTLTIKALRTVDMAKNYTAITKIGISYIQNYFNYIMCPNMIPEVF